MSKLRTRHHPRLSIHAQHVAREEFRLCNGEKCQNAIALWAKEVFCSRCRGRKVRR